MKMEARRLTDRFFFDTDCLSAFLWVHGESILIATPDSGMRIIGKGEAAAIAMVKERGGTIASNNLKDVSSYVEKYGLEHITTGDILMQAMRSGIISEADGNDIWTNMIRKRRMLPTATFADYIKSKPI